MLGSSPGNLPSGGQDWTPLAKFLESGVEEYERALAACGGGLVRGRSAWNDNEPNLASGDQDWTPLAKLSESGRRSTIGQWRPGARPQRLERQRAELG